MSAAFTPGPWYAGDIIDRGAVDDEHCMIWGPSPARYPYVRGDLVADCVAPRNAGLIVAAPDLYADLTHLVAIARKVHHSEKYAAELAGMCARAEATLAKVAA